MTTSVRGFTTLLLGLYFAEQVDAASRQPSPPTVDTFLKFEQMVGFARLHRGDDSSVRGYRRLRSRMAGKVSISVTADDQILANQKVYGLWGLFSMPARASGLVDSHAQRLTEAARAFVEKRYIPLITRSAGRGIVDLLRRDSFTFDVRGDLADALANCHGALTPDERQFYRRHLVEGGDHDPTGGRQSELASLLERVGTDATEFRFEEFRALVAQARKSREDLRVALARIGALEQLLMPARNAFNFLLSQNGQTLDEVARKVSRSWTRPVSLDEKSLEDARDLLARAVEQQLVDRWFVIERLMQTADWKGLLDALVGLNTRVMQLRHGSAPWVTIESGSVRVSMPDVSERLLPVRDVERLWQSTYFINSLWAVTHEVSS